MMGANLEQLAKDLQKLLASTVNKAGVFEREPPRDEAGEITAKMPFVVYSADTQSPVVENGVYTVDLFIDIWAQNGWAGCYRQAMLIDAALDQTVYNLPSGTICCDQNGQVMSRGERDPDDERLRRMQGQYQIRFYPNL